MTTLYILDFASGNVSMLPYESGKQHEEIEEDIINAGFRLNDIEWMVSDGVVLTGWPQ